MHLRNHSMGREIGYVMVIKIIALFVLWLCFFSGDQHVHPSKTEFTEKFIGNY